MRSAPLVALLLCAQLARADSLADEADFRFRRGTTLYRKGALEEALGEFLASNRLVRNRNALFNVARCFEQLGRFNEAYRSYLEVWNDEMPEADHRELEEALKRLRPSLALLQVESDPPGATVYVERKDLGARGQTPVTLALPPGRATVWVELPGFHPFQQALTLATGRTASLRPGLRPLLGSIEVSGEPQPVEARLDDGPPLPLLQGKAEVAAGAHLLTLSAPGHLGEQIAIEVPADGIAPIKFRLLPIPPPSGALVVRANLDGALVRIDGRPAGFTPGVIDNLPVGNHRVEITAEGREPVVQELQVQQDERRFVEVKLRSAMPRVVAAEKDLTRAQDAPASVTVISAEEIRGFGYTTLAEALQGVRGLSTSYDRDYAAVGVRGFGSPGGYNSRVLVLSDGHVTNEASLGQGFVGHDFDADLSDVERIEVVRGPGSVLYGSSAFFAVVNVVHRAPAPGLHGEAGGLAGTLGENSGHLIASAASADSFVWARGSGLRMSGDPFFSDPGAPSRVARDLDGERSGHADLRARSGDFTLLASYNDRRKDLPTGAFDTVFGAAGTSTRDQRGFIEARYGHVFASGLAIDVRAAYDGERYRGSWLYAGRPPGVLGSDTSAEDWGSAEVRVKLPDPGGHRIFFGAEAQHRFRVDLTSDVPATSDGRTPATSFANFGGANTQRDPDSELVLSAFAGDDWRLGPRAQLDLAVRVDGYRDFNPPGSADRQTPPAVNPRLALLLQPYEGGHTKILLGRAFRRPGFYERFFNDGGISQARARDLRPEAVYTGEIEHAHQVNDEVSATVAAYLSEMQDLIRAGSPPGQPTVSQYQNQSSPTHAAGGELEVRWQAGPGFLVSAWYAFSLVREDPGAWFAGSPLPNSPQNTGAVRVLFPLVPQALSLSSELMYGGPRRSVPNPDGSVGLLGESLLWNLGLSGEHRRLRYGAFVTDLLDQRPVMPAGPEISFPNHGVPQYGRMLRLTLAAYF